MASDQPEPAPQSARDLTRRRARRYTAPATGRHHHMGAAPERQPVVVDGGSAWVNAWTEAADVQLRSLTTAQLAERAADLQRRMQAAGDAMEYEVAADLLRRLRAVEDHAAARVAGGDPA